MKKNYATILLAALILHCSIFVVSANGQEGSRDNGKNKDEEKEVVIGKGFLKVTDNDSMLNVHVGNRNLSILESLEGEGSEIRLEKYSRERNDEFWNRDNKDEERERRRLRFRGNWSGFEFGFNNYTSSRNSIVIPGDIPYMNLHSGKSNNFNFNFAQRSIGLGRHIGLVTGMGVNWNNYRFEGNNSIMETANNGPVDVRLPDPQDAVLKRSKLATVYLHAPLLLEVQIPADNNHLNISGGVIGGLKVFSHTKMVYDDGHKVKSNNDFNLNLLRYGFTARAGYSNFQVYATYYVSPLFEDGKGPGGHDLYPFEIGFAFTFNN